MRTFIQIMMLLIHIVMALGGLWCLASIILLIPSHLTPRRRQLFYEDRKILGYSIIIGSLLGVGIIIGVGIQPLLTFIPESWGGISEDGDWVSTRQAIGYFAGFVGSGLLLETLGKKLFFPIEEKTRREKETKLAARLNELEKMSPEDRRRALENHKKNADNIRSLIPDTREIEQWARYMTAEQFDELEMFWDLQYREWKDQ